MDSKLTINGNPKFWPDAVGFARKFLEEHPNWFGKPKGELSVQQYTIDGKDWVEVTFFVWQIKGNKVFVEIKARPFTPAVT